MPRLLSQAQIDKWLSPRFPIFRWIGTSFDVQIPVTPPKIVGMLTMLTIL